MRGKIGLKKNTRGGKLAEASFRLIGCIGICPSFTAKMSFSSAGFSK